MPRERKSKLSFVWKPDKHEKSPSLFRLCTEDLGLLLHPGQVKTELDDVIVGNREIDITH